jgi:hypothetical protein
VNALCRFVELAGSALWTTRTEQGVAVTLAG